MLENSFFKALPACRHEHPSPVPPKICMHDGAWGAHFAERVEKVYSG